MVGVGGRHGQEQQSAWLQNTEELGGCQEWVGDMLQHLGADDDIVGVVGDGWAVLDIGDDRDAGRGGNVDNVIALDQGGSEESKVPPIAELQEAPTALGGMST